MKIKQITFDEALALVRNGESVHVIKRRESGKSVIIKKFDTLIIGDMIKNYDKLIFCVIEEAK